MLRGEAPVVFGDGEQARDFVYVGDVAEANLLAVERRLQGGYNVGVGEAASVNHVTAELASACGYDGPIDHAPERDGEVRSIMLDAGKLTRETGWRPTVSLAEGIRLTVADHKARLSRVG
jgi:UDP-glucose 4-epimerase